MGLSTFELIKEVGKMENCDVFVRAGYPPAELSGDFTLPLSCYEIGDGDMLMVEEIPVRVEPPAKASKPKETTTNTAPKTGPRMIRRIIAADNSCLFNSITYALENRDRTRASELRALVAALLLSDAEKYRAFLTDKTLEEYCQWIQRDSSWGGDIELTALSEYYGVEMVAIDVITASPSFFGGGERRIYLLYDGIHYDILARNVSEEADERTDETVFSPTDKKALDEAIELAKDLKAKRQYTDVSKFSIQCMVCGSCFVGEAQAVEHGKATGHMNFTEVK
eukprot:TRINITY_DN10555_c0_g1_i5.p1 TRINITY_DN10555_c0_g1~~TRINITY_DN10555_c0_g1_i5.p1  ORF type:complete len:281 (+),score=62.80 TRINITY_DN10555_c0_g1_i5:141-983(+)